MLRKSEKPLEQIAKRFSEKEKSFKEKVVLSETYLTPHNSGPLIINNDCNEVNTKQYKVYKTEKFTVDCNKIEDTCLLLKNETVVIVENIIFCPIKKEYKLIGEELEKIQSLFCTM